MVHWWCGGHPLITKANNMGKYDYAIRLTRAHDPAYLLSVATVALCALVLWA